MQPRFVLLPRRRSSHNTVVAIAAEPDELRRLLVRQVRKAESQHGDSAIEHVVQEVDIEHQPVAVGLRG